MSTATLSRQSKEKYRIAMVRHMTKCSKCEHWFKKPMPKTDFLDGMCSYGKGLIVKVA